MNEGAPGRAEVRRDLAVIAIGCAVLYFVALGARDLWNPNEPTYGQAVVEMAARGNWWLPTVNGNVFAEKPILYYWLALVVSKLAGGVSEWTLRVPSALAGVAGALLVYALVIPYAGAPRARLAAAFFATQYLVWSSARSVQMDLLVTVTTLASALFATRAIDAGPSRRQDGREARLFGLNRWTFGWALAGAAAGLGVMAKGPVGLIYPAIAIATYLAGSHRLRVLLSPGPAVAIVVALAVASPWYLVLVARGETDALREVLVRQNVTRVFDPWDHERAWWYYLKHFWIDFAPWSWFTPFAVLLPERDGDERRLDLLAWSWIAATLCFLSLSPSKRSPYLLPIAPAVAILASGVLGHFLGKRLEQWRRVLVALVLTAGGIVAAAAGVLIARRAGAEYAEFSHLAGAFAMLAVAGGGVIVTCMALRRSGGAVAAWIALLVAAYLFTSVSVFPAVNPRKSARQFCERLVAVVPEGERLGSYRLWEFRGSYAFYSGRSITNLTSVDSLRAWWDSPEPAYVLVEGGRLSELRQVVGDREPLVRTTIGRTTVQLFGNR